MPYKNPGKTTAQGILRENLLNLECQGDSFFVHCSRDDRVKIRARLGVEITRINRKNPNGPIYIKTRSTERGITVTRTNEAK